jgi:hypothetical protein
MGFQRGRNAFSLGRAFGSSLGQALSKIDRDHYLDTVSRAITEANEIDAWLKATPGAQLRPATGAPATVTDSPYYTKWFNYQPHRADMQALKDRLTSEDPTTWGSLTKEEHGTFGWVSVVDQVYAAFQADPLNLTAGRWQDGTRLPDDQAVKEAAQPSLLSTPVLIGAGVLAAVGLLYFATK